MPKTPSERQKMVVQSVRQIRPLNIAFVKLQTFLVHCFFLNWDYFPQKNCVPESWIRHYGGDEHLLRCSRKVFFSLPSTIYVICLLLPWVEELCDLSFVKSKNHTPGNAHFSSSTVVCQRLGSKKKCNVLYSSFSPYFWPTHGKCALCDFTVVRKSCFLLSIHRFC